MTLASDEAYKSQKQCGFVFARKELKQVVWLASQIVFFEKFGAVMSQDAHHFCKTDDSAGSSVKQWLEEAQKAHVCSEECVQALITEKPRLLPLRVGDVMLPKGWIEEDTELPKKLAQEFFNVLPGGLIASVHSGFVDGLKHLSNVADTFYKTGKFKSTSKLDEPKGLQAAILESLLNLGVDAREGTEVGGGETDIILPGNIVVENKVVGETSVPKSEKTEADWQARRYSMAFSRRISFVVIAYKPQKESALLSPSNSIEIRALESCPEPHAVVRILIPWGYGNPSSVKAPK